MKNERTLTMRSLIMAGCAMAGAMATVQAADAQSSAGILMRRPIPQLSTTGGTPVSTPTPGSQQPGGGTPTPTPPGGQEPTPGTPTPTPAPEVPGEEGQAPDPQQAVCDQDTVSTADITDVAWIEKGWKSAGEGMCGSVMQYACQATYTCAVGGKTTTFVSETKDSVCEGYGGKVTYPTASDPSAASANTFLTAGRRAYVATASTMSIPKTSADLGLSGYDFLGKGSDYGPEFTDLVQSYFAKVADDDTCRQINTALGLKLRDVPAYDPVGRPESCGIYPTGSLYYMKRIDTAQASRQAGYVRSLGAMAVQRANAGANTESVETLGLGGVEKYNLISGMGVEDATGGKRVYWLNLASPAVCAEIDRTVNGSRTGSALAAYQPATLDEGCGTYGWTSSAYYWKRIGSNIFPDMTCTGAYQYRKVAGVRTVSIEGQTGAVLPDKLCWGSDVTAPKGDRHLFVQEDGNVVMYNRPGQDGAAWASGTQYAGTRMFAMAADGNLAAYDQSGTVRWQSNTRGNPGAYAVFMSTGNLMVMSAKDDVLWQSNSGTYDPVDVGQKEKSGSLVPMKMNAGEFVTSPNGRSKLVLQTDNNFVLYINGGAKWASGTQYAGAYTFLTQPTGGVVLVSKEGRTLWSAGMPGIPGSRLRVLDNGNVVLTAPDGRIVWETKTGSEPTIVAG